MLIRWNDLTDRLVGKTARGRRPAIRWPNGVADLKLAENWGAANIALGVTTLSSFIIGLALASIPIASIPSSVLALGSIAAFLGSFVLAILSLTSVYALDNYKEKENVTRGSKTRQIMEPLLGKDPYLDLRLAAFLTMGAMPEWLRAQMRHESSSARRPAWLEARFTEEPYTVERAGLDYLELASSIELWAEVPDGSFHGKSFPSSNRRLPDPLKDAVVEIVLFLSSLPDSWEEPDEETMEAVMRAIDRMATIDGESFVEAVRRLREEDEDKKRAAENKARADYNGEVMKAVDASMNTMDAKADEQYEAVQRGMNLLSKMDKLAARSVVPLSPATVYRLPRK